MTPHPMTPLDKAHARLLAAPGDRAARLRFHEAVAATPLLLLLEDTPEGDRIRPRILPVEGRDCVLAFDSDDRLAAFHEGAAFVAMPGADLARMLKGQGLGIALNAGVAPLATVLPPDAVDWLAEIAAEIDARALEEPLEGAGRLSALSRPAGFPADLLGALDSRLRAAAGHARVAFLARARHADGTSGFVLALPGVPETAQPAIARALAEAVAFSAEEVTLDVAFPPEGARILDSFARVGLRLDLPAPAAPQEAAAPEPPGSDPDRPPILRP